MKLFFKKHSWQGRKTWLSLELESASRDININEGFINLKVGEEDYPKAGFKLSVDEARALRDAITEGLRSHDEKLRKLMNEEEIPYEHEHYGELHKHDESVSSEPVVTNFGDFMSQEPVYEDKAIDEEEDFKLFKPKKQEKQEESELYY